MHLPLRISRNSRCRVRPQKHEPRHAPEKRKHTKDARLVHRHHLSFQHAEALGMRVALQSFHHEYTVGCRFDTLCLQFWIISSVSTLIIYMYLLLFYLSRCKDTKYNKIFALFYYKYLLFSSLCSLFSIFEVPLHFRTLNKNL